MIDELPDAPDPATDSPTEFNAKAAALVLAQKAMVPQINAALTALNAFMAGGAYAFPFVFDSATTDADPGTGKLRLGSSTQNVATTLRIDNMMAGGADVSAIWTDLLSVTSATKGSVRIVKSGDMSKWMILDVTGAAAATGYRNLAVSVRFASEANPFQHGDPVTVYVQRNGDKGEIGSAAAFPYMRVSDVKASGTDGGASVADSWQYRTLNTVEQNDIPGASLSSSIITLPAGTYEVQAAAVAWAADRHRIRLYNITDNTVLVNGLNALSPSGAAVSQTTALLEGRFTIAATKQVRLAHYTYVAFARGLGIETIGSVVTASLFAQVSLRKVG